MIEEGKSQCVSRKTESAGAEVKLTVQNKEKPCEESETTLLTELCIRQKDQKGGN